LDVSFVLIFKPQHYELRDQLTGRHGRRTICGSGQQAKGENAYGPGSLHRDRRQYTDNAGRGLGQSGSLFFKALASSDRRFKIRDIRSRSSACSSFLSRGGFSLLTDLDSFEIPVETSPANPFDKDDDGCKHEYQRDGAQVKLKNKSQHPDEHEKHENCRKHQ
jgi:hypothetical protein